MAFDPTNTQQLAQARVIVSTNDPATVLDIAAARGVPARVIGQVGPVGAPLQISTAAVRFIAPLARLDDAYHETIPRIMAQSALASQ